ncbi:MAG TPA: hypothetical protein VHW60_12970 [Caulobacteraceae bacterium]|nr:hypothetical protein [Caulobacteraceae bacterium]
MALDQRLKSMARASGTPIMPAITATGSGAVIAATISTSSPAGMAAASSAASRSMAGRIASIAAGVNALASRPRSTEWRGGSSESSGNPGPIAPAPIDADENRP